jgi:hypothetical protein
MSASCTACGGKRKPFATTTLNLAGTPWRIGGAAAVVVGSVALVSGLAFSAFLFFLLGWLFPGTLAAYAFAVPTLLVTLAFSITALVSGRALGKHGKQKERSAQLQTIRALANHHGGVLTAATAAGSLEVPEDQADTILTDLAKSQDDVTLDLDDNGSVHYLFGVGGEALRDAKWRVAMPQAGARVATPAPQVAPVDPQAAAIAEAEAELDAEFQADADQRHREQ